MADLADILPGRRDRVFLVGQTGCGKTTLAETMLRTRPYVACIDPKGLLGWNDYRVFTSLRSFCSAPVSRVPRRIFRPTVEQLNDGSVTEQFFEWVYRSGQWTVYVDEAGAVTEGQIIPIYYKACLQRGREHGIETWSATQRPMNVPNVIMSESEHAYLFFLKMEGDREKVGRMCQLNPDLMAVMPNGQRLRKHFFYYVPQEGDPRGPLTLTLS